MVFDHVGIMNEEEAGALEFYRDIVGLEKIRESSVMPELAQKLFSVDVEIKMLVFGKDGLKVEVFIVPGFTRPSPSVPHFCIQVPELAGFLEKAKKEGVKLISGERGGRTVHFIEDFSGNRIEVKQ
jgi:catechol 2,3-dioxygenase-like lactoylglutathione lyase family enzyme